MSRPYATDEQYERWFMADCCRCGRRRNKAGSWPDGYICRTCLDRALLNRGNCPGCDQHRALPGRRPGDGVPICTTCAGFSQSFACARCGYEGKLHGGRRCTRCTLADRLAELLDDGTGRIHPRLAPLARHLLGMDNPLSGLTWLSERRRTAATLLRGLACGEIPLTHEAFRTLQPWRAATHLRELLMARGLLPAIDKQVLLFERLLHEHLTGLADPDHAQILRRFATWHVLPRLRARAETRPISPVGRRYAGEQLLQAPPYSHGSQAAAGSSPTAPRATSTPGPSNRPTATASTSEHSCSGQPKPGSPAASSCPPRTAPASHRGPNMTAPHCSAKVLTGEDAPLRSRAAAVILLLYAQPLSRITRLTIDDIVRDGGQVLLRLGNPPSPVPEPVATLLLEYLGQRTNMSTATNHASRWLFPGRCPGQPLRSDTLSALLVHDVGVPATAGRDAAIRQHVLALPAPIVATALGYHHNTTTRHTAEAGTTWAGYAANGR